MKEELPKQIGHYEIVEVLGSGGMSTVYKGIQPSLNRSVAIKVLPIHMAKEEELVGRFERESSIIASLNHPNIIQIYDRGVDEGNYYIVMELVDGGGLDRMIHAKPLPIYQVVNFAVQIARGLEFAHAKGVVHRDIKPSNILISSESGTVKISDFGIAKLAEEQMADRMLTREKTAIGTADYMSPEQRRDSRQIDARSDIFSFGILLYEMVAGRIPIGRFRNLHELRDDTPPLLNQIVIRCLQEDPVDRYPSFTEVIADLNKVTQRGLVYREAIDRMAESVFLLRSRAKTAITENFSTMPWTKRLKVVGLIAGAMAATIYLSVLVVNAVREGPSEPEALSQEERQSEAPEKAEASEREEPSGHTRVIKKSPVKEQKPEFTTADAYLKERRYDDALEVLREIRTEAGEANNAKRAAEAQWRIATIHRERGSLASAGVAYGYFVDTYGQSPEIVSTERIGDALYYAGIYNADGGEYERALPYLRGLRERYPGYAKSEEAMYREVIVMSDHIKPKRSERDQHRRGTVRLCRSFCDRFRSSKHREEVLWRMAETYQDLGEDEDYVRAVEALEEMGRDFQRSSHLPLYEAAELSRKKLKDKDRARRDYEAFIAANPASDKTDDARKRLERLD